VCSAEDLFLASVKVDPVLEEAAAAAAAAADQQAAAAAKVCELSVLHVSNVACHLS